MLCRGRLYARILLSAASWYGCETEVEIATADLEGRRVGRTIGRAGVGRRLWTVVVSHDPANGEMPSWTAHSGSSSRGNVNHVVLFECLECLVLYTYNFRRVSERTYSLTIHHLGYHAIIAPR